MKTKWKVKLNCLSVTCMFSPHKNTNMFTISGLRSGLLFYFSVKTKSSVSHRFLNIRFILPRATRTFTLMLTRWVTCKPGSTPEALALKAPLHVISEIWLLLHCMCRGSSTLAVWRSADHTLAQMLPRQILTRPFSKKLHKYDHFGHSLEPWFICSIFVEIIKVKISKKKGA